jgi:hypothetical protein
MLSTAIALLLAWTPQSPPLGANRFSAAPRVVMYVKPPLRPRSTNFLIEEINHWKAKAEQATDKLKGSLPGAKFVALQEEARNRIIQQEMEAKDMMARFETEKKALEEELGTQKAALAASERALLEFKSLPLQHLASHAIKRDGLIHALAGAVVGSLISLIQGCVVAVGQALSSCGHKIRYVFTGHTSSGPMRPSVKRKLEVA